MLRDRRARHRAAARLERRRQRPRQPTTHRAYELLAQGFGKGFNGPLLVVAKVPDPPSATGRSNGLRDGDRRRRPERVAVAPAEFNPAGSVATISVYPRSSPQAYATTQLVLATARTGDPAGRRAHRA